MTPGLRATVTLGLAALLLSTTAAGTSISSAHTLVRPSVSVRQGVPSTSACRGVPRVVAAKGYPYRTLHLLPYLALILADPPSHHLFAFERTTVPDGSFGSLVNGCSPPATGTLVTLDLRSGRAEKATAVGDIVSSAVVDDRSNRLFFVAAEQHHPFGYVTVVDTRTGEVVRRAADLVAPGSWAVAPWAHRAFHAAGDVHVLDASSGAGVATLRLAATGVTVDRTLRRVFVAGDGIVVVDARTGRVLATWPAPGCGGQLAVDERIHRLYTASPGIVNDRYNLTDPTANPPGSLCVIDDRSGRVVSRRSGPAGFGSHIMAVNASAGYVVAYSESAGGDAGPPSDPEAVDARTGRHARALGGLAMLPNPFAPQGFDAPPAADVRSAGLVLPFGASYDGTAGRYTVSLRLAGTKVGVFSPIARSVPVPYTAAAASSPHELFLGDVFTGEVRVLCLDAKC